MTTCGKLILDRDGDPTVDLACSWQFTTAQPGSAGICAAWHLDRIAATDADTGAPVELDPAEVEYITRRIEPNLGITTKGTK